MDFTVACVPTGIKIGVSTVLWAVEKETALAADPPSAPIRRKDNLSNIQKPLRMVRFGTVHKTRKVHKVSYNIYNGYWGV
jgi:hypothetical protein